MGLREKRRMDFIINNPFSFHFMHLMLFPQVKELSKRNVNFWNLGLSFLYVSSLWYLLGDRLNDQPLSPSHGSPIKEFSIPWLIIVPISLRVPPVPNLFGGGLNCL